MEENNTTVETKSPENNIPEINKDVNNDTDKCSDITSKDINHANDSGDNNTPVKTTLEEHLERRDAPECHREMSGYRRKQSARKYLYLRCGYLYICGMQDLRYARCLHQKTQWS